MISFITKTTDRSVLATCPLGSALRGTGMSGAVALLPAFRVSDRPTQAPAAAAVAQAHAYAFAANGAGRMKQHPNWAFRGLGPWSDPA